MRNQPSQKSRYQTLKPLLATFTEELTAQARTRPQVTAPPGMRNMAQKLLRETHHQLRGQPGLHLLTPLPKTADIPLGTLALTLGQARTALEAFGAAAGLDDTTAPDDPAMTELREKLAARIDQLRAGQV